MNRKYKRFLYLEFIDTFSFLYRFLGRVNDKGSAFKEFLIMTGIANPLAQVSVL